MRLGLSGLLLLLVGEAALATPAWPDLEAMAAARKSHPFPNIAVPSNATMPRMPDPGIPPSLDLRRLTKPAELSTQQASSEAPTLLVFVTLALPRASLERLIAQAEQARAVVLLRGLHAKSMRETLKTIEGLRGQHQIRIEIDPESFTRYQISTAPSVVLLLTARSMQCQEGTAPQESYLKVAGDVSLDYALERMQRLRPTAGPQISPLLARLAPR